MPNISVTSYARINVRQRSYALIAINNYMKFVSKLEERKRILRENSKSSSESREFYDSVSEIERDMDEYGCTSIIYSAMCMEAAAYDVFAVHLGDGFASDHIDKLDVLSKWMLIIKFIFGADIDKSGKTYFCLKKLISARNKLVHHKSEQLPFGDDAIGNMFEKMEKEEKRFINDVELSIKAIVYMSLYIGTIYDGLFGFLPNFSGDDMSCVLRERVYPAGFEDIISRWRAGFK
ncbi:MAG TPA: hypothetical protein VM661_12770 [Candidatus Sulfotelmatobacter sp.]|jgi:hypothetical protein|nr:hypothetical protein [Candidatus Sulfotelmatobacter sp.]